MLARTIVWIVLAGVAIGGCTHVPGETLTAGGLQRDVKARVLTLATSAKPQCRRAAIVHTEVVELHPDGKVALERWTVDECGEKVPYQVNFRPAGRGQTFVVRRNE